MFQSAKKLRPLSTFKFPAKIEVYRPEFELFASVRHLDLAKLARAARAEIELGYLKNSCCPQMVRAIIRKGMVEDLRIEACSESKKERPSAELLRVLDLAYRRASGQGKRPPRLPMPVMAFMRNVSNISTDTITLVCFSICIYGYCLLCCKNEATGQWVCSPRGIVIKPPKQ